MSIPAETNNEKVDDHWSSTFFVHPGKNFVTLMTDGWHRLEKAQGWHNEPDMRHRIEP
ncbi:MAG: hypothetical protein ACKO5E_22760 [bacterium]